MRIRCRQARARLIVPGLTGVLITASTAAQVFAPVEFDQPQPVIPTNRMDMPQEGWVVVRYSVLEDGSTDNVRVVDSMPPQLSSQATVEAVGGWTFEPARADGAPIEWHNNESVIVFDAADVPDTPSPVFMGAWQEAQTLLQSGDYDRALRSNEQMLARAARLNEIGLALMQNTSINVQRGDLHAAYAAILRATDERVPVLQSQDLAIALQYRNALELQLGDIVSALATLERRRALAPVPDDDPVAASAPRIEQALSDGTTLAIEAQILDDHWRHALERRSFALDVVDGDIDAIQVECDRRVAELEYSADAEWSLPQSWGACTVTVEGRDETTFRFYEFQ